MAGSLQRPPFNNIPTHKDSRSSTSIKYKSIIIIENENEKLRLKGSHRSNCINKNNESNNCNYNNGSSIGIIGQEKKKPQQLHQLLKQLNYCESLSLQAKLLLLLPSSLSVSLSSSSSSLLLSLLFSNNSCWTATENKKCYNNLITTKTAAIAINYVQQHQQQQQQQHLQQKQQQQQHQQYQLLQLQQRQKQLQLLQLLQILNKVFKSSKFRKNLLNRKKLQLRELQSYRKKSIV